MQVKNTTQTHIKMIDKLKKEGRLEFLVKNVLIENKYNTERILTFLFGIIGIIIVSVGLTFLGFIVLVVFVLFSIRDRITFLNNKKNLFNEYFEVKPRSNKR